MIVYVNKKLTPISISLCCLNSFIGAKEYTLRVKISNCVEGHKVNVLLPISKSRCVTIYLCNYRNTLYLYKKEKVFKIHIPIILVK